jgi:hypothetical protein
MDQGQWMRNEARYFRLGEHCRVGLKGVQEAKSLY